MLQLTEKMDSQIELLLHFPDVLRKFSSNGLLLVHENGIFLTNEASEPDDTLHEINVECSLLTCEGVPVT